MKKEPEVKEHVVQLTLRGELEEDKEKIIDKLKSFLRREGFEIEHHPEIRPDANMMIIRWKET